MPCMDEEQKDLHLWKQYWEAEQKACDYRATLPAKKADWTQGQVEKMDSLRATSATLLSAYCQYIPPSRRRFGIDF